LICGVSRTEASSTAPTRLRYFMAVAINPPMPAKLLREIDLGPWVLVRLPDTGCEKIATKKD
jgi:hypothetical protein